MLDRSYPRIFTLFGLAALGVGLAVIGTAVGVGGPITDAGPSATFTVSEDNVTLSDGDRAVTVVETMVGVDRLEITEEEAGRFEVRTESGDPVADDERDRAVEIARNNETVRRHLDRMESYDLAVEPIVKLDVGAVRTTNLSVNLTERDSDASDHGAEFTIEGTAERDRNGSVSIVRDPTHAEDEVLVRITRPPDDEVKYSVHVDLANETVVGITDWREIRSDSETLQSAPHQIAG